MWILSASRVTSVRGGSAAPQIAPTIQGDRCMNTVTSRIITGISVVLVTSAMLGACAPDSEAEKAITTFYNRYLTKCGDSWYADITFAIAEKGTPRFMNIQSLAVTLLPDKLHTVDALYGIEWRGRAILGSPFREYDQQQHAWSAWKQGTVPLEPYLHDLLNYELLVSAIKNLGQWNIRFPTHAPQMGITLNWLRVLQTGLTSCSIGRNLNSPGRINLRVNLDLWYPVPPTKGGHSHGQFTIRRRPDSPHGGAGFDQSHVGGVAAVGSAF